MPNKASYTVGKISGFHGIQGVAKIKVNQGRQEGFMLLDSVKVETPDGKSKILHIEWVRIHKTDLLVKFKEFQNPNDVNDFKGCMLHAEESVVKETLKPGEYLVEDLLGLIAFDMDDNRLGVVKDVIGSGAQDILKIQNERGQEFLVPFVDELVPKVIVKEGRVIINPIEGLIEQ
jgi:16S rRNA processing protein RimM